jgi:uncharacterized protein YjbI with pentapeptide repeats
MPCALTTSLIEAQLFGADVCRAHLRGTRLRGADRRQASLGEVGLSVRTDWAQTCAGRTSVRRISGLQT